MKYEILDMQSSETSSVESRSPDNAAYEYLRSKYKKFQNIRLLGEFQGLYRFEIYLDKEIWIYEHYRVSEVSE